MGRPRKNRVGEYAEHLIDEIALQLKQELLKTVNESQKAYQSELNSLKAEIRKLTKQVEALKKSQSVKPRLGKWVPGGPGRPPKDAEERIAAFENRRSSKE